jgi:indoleamine 2,3-dioxygenase
MALCLEDFSSYQVDPERGFLPSQDPLEKLPKAYEIWDQIGAELSALLVTGKLRSTLERLVPLELGGLRDNRERERAILLLSVFGNAYVWADLRKPAARIPKGVAMPLCQLAEMLGRPPIITHASIVLHNWRRLDRSAPIDLDNLACLQLFLGGLDEQWFYLDGVAIERQGAPALVASVAGQKAVSENRPDALLENLAKMAASLATVNATLMRMYDFCDPYVFYHRVRPYLTGWDAPGVIYEGVSDQPQKYFGGSAAQSPWFQVIDAALGVEHRDRETHPYLTEMRRYMTPAHRRFIEAMETGPSIRKFVLAHQQAEPSLCDVYNQCVGEMEKFRKKHFEIAVRYIAHQAPKGIEAKGTGGTSFSAFLGKALKETSESVID